VIRIVIGALALVCGGMSAWANDLSAAKPNADPAPMRFEWRVEGPARQCGSHCRSWISAIGVITENSARDFEAFAKDKEIHGATIVLDSEGGSVRAALALGRLIRSFDMTTTVGKTIALPSVDGDKSRATLSPDASCESMCAFLLLSGTRRYVPPQARVLVHQIWLGDKSKHALEASYTAEELGLVQRDIGTIARYTVEMGGGIELLETALRTPPWKPMYSLSADEIRRMRLTTVERLFEPETPPAISTVGHSSPPVASAIQTTGSN
jgi:hypothetical protein